MEDNEPKKSVVYDYAKDMRHESKVSKILVLALTGVLALMVIGTVVICIANQRSTERIAKHTTETIISFMSQYDYETTIDVSTADNVLDAGNVTIQR